MGKERRIKKKHLLLSIVRKWSYLLILPLPPGDNPIAVNKYYYYYYINKPT
jgi:hypothetical protein